VLSWGERPWCSCSSDVDGRVAKREGLIMGVGEGGRGEPAAAGVPPARGRCPRLPTAVDGDRRGATGVGCCGLSPRPGGRSGRGCTQLRPDAARSPVVARGRRRAAARPRSLGENIPRRLTRPRERSLVRPPPRNHRRKCTHLRLVPGVRSGWGWRGLPPPDEGEGETRSGVLAAGVYSRRLTGWQALPYFGVRGTSPARAAVFRRVAGSRHENAGDGGRPVPTTRARVISSRGRLGI
jgi:hypothetical protein